MSIGFICCRCCLRWRDSDVGNRRSGLLFYSAGNVLGLLVSGARWYRLSLYLMGVILSLAGDVVRLVLAFCGWWYGLSLHAMDDVVGLAGGVVRFLLAFGGVRCDFSLDILGRSYLAWRWVHI
ncbi:uncharacterized protein LOC120354030 isoform X2 [Nilaparvata lugens]|uniref:uncharacterized protein LOC120354030 isoform X2 n=1 Tax=Nilaparvata lugens TaxID=108931 RepID=UPI00193EA5ED|nr:uncharacterized protein LOC120354030 isoform X2 [Nilaparvata lugens]